MSALRLCATKGVALAVVVTTLATGAQAQPEARPPEATQVIAVADGGRVDAGTPPAAPLSVQQAVAPEQVKLGERFTLTVVLVHARNQRWELRRPTELGEFEILGHQRRRNDAGQQATTTFELEFAAFELGVRTLPPLTFEVTSPDGRTDWSPPPMTVEVVATLPPDAAEKGANLYDIRPPEEVPVPSYTLLWVLLGLVLAALAAWLLYRWWKRRQVAQAAASAPPVAPEVRARAELDLLKAEDLPAKGEVKAFYIRLSDILRGYLGHRYGVEALECTSSELLDALDRVHAPDLPKEALAAFLQESDLVKFARAQMSVEACGHALSFGYRLLEETKPRPPPPPLPDATAR